MLYVDLKYIALVGTHLRNFKRKKDNLFNCSCPICGDSEKKKTKARGYFFQKSTSMIFKCHNCSAGMGMANFLRHSFPNYYDQYILEKYKSGVETKTIKALVEETPKITFNKFSSTHATRISELPDAHYAKQYVLGRKIPTHSHSRIYFTDDFAKLVDDVFPDKYQNLQQAEPRLVIPFFNANGDLIGLQGRSFSPEKALRYLTIRASSTTDLIYGLDKCNFNKTVYVVEGPLDSLFIENALAAANSDLCGAIQKIPSSCDCVLVYDNEPKNKEIVALVEDAIKKNKKVCIWPSFVKQKDINDMILSGTDTEQIQTLIQKNTFQGLTAQLEFSKWKKI